MIIIFITIAQLIYLLLINTYSIFSYTT